MELEDYEQETTPRFRPILVADVQVTPKKTTIAFRPKVKDPDWIVDKFGICRRFARADHGLGGIRD